MAKTQKGTDRQLLIRSRPERLGLKQNPEREKKPKQKILLADGSVQKTILQRVKPIQIIQPLATPLKVPETARNVKVNRIVQPIAPLLAMVSETIVGVALQNE
jgi:hypothetical protein